MEYNVHVFPNARGSFETNNYITMALSTLNHGAQCSLNLKHQPHHKISSNLMTARPPEGKFV